MPWTAAAIGGSAVLGAGSSLASGGKAASGAKQSADMQKQMYLQTRSDLSPFTAAGASVLPQLTNLATSGPTGGGPNYVDQASTLVPPTMTQAELEKTPGYQWNLSQGLKAAQSAAAARGLGVSGASLKGAATYATGLADSTYQNQFANAQQRFSDYLNLNTAQQGNLLNQYNRLSGVATLGANAGAQVGSQGATLANQAGSALQAAGNAQAAGTMGAANAVTNGLNSYLGYQSLQNALKAPSPTTGGYLTSGGYSNAPPTPVSMPIIPPSA
jgi:hypothetical protein